MVVRHEQQKLPIKTRNEMSLEIVGVHSFGVSAKALKPVKVQPGNWFTVHSECEGKQPWQVEVTDVENMETGFVTIQCTKETQSLSVSKEQSCLIFSQETLCTKLHPHVLVFSFA